MYQVLEHERMPWHKCVECGRGSGGLAASASASPVQLDDPGKHEELQKIFRTALPMLHEPI